jgi:apolipoprotein N-acyltransferase
MRGVAARKDAGKARAAAGFDRPPGAPHTRLSDVSSDVRRPALALAPAPWAIAARVRLLRGWRKRAVALLAGAASVLALAPFFAWPVLWLTLPALVWLIDGAVLPSAARPAGPAAAPRQGEEWRSGAWRRLLAAAEIGWWFWFGYFLAGLFWVGDAFLVEAESFGFLLPFAVTLLPAGMALYHAMAVAIAACIWRPGWVRVLALALAVAAGEWLRGHALTGFPWNLIGYALTYPLSLMQSAAYLGVYGLSLCAVVIFALPAVLLAARPEGSGRRRTIAAAIIAFAPLTLAALVGEIRLAAAGPSAVPGVKLRLVQPSVPQREKWRPEFQEHIFLDHLRLSLTDATGKLDGAAGVTHVVWPEAAMPFLVLDNAAARDAIGHMLPAGTLLIAGGLRATAAADGQPRRVFNSILVLGADGSLLARYDKVHLVPFGEYLPMQAVLESVGLRQLTRQRGGFTPGRAPRSLLRVPGLPPAAPLICYEAVFPSAIVETNERPEFLLNVTNDGWFGDTTGPRQHFHQARVRAVEEGAALIRVANNGISGVVDGHGRILHRLGLDQRGTIDTELPAPLPPPPYARFGDGIFLLLWLAGASVLAWSARSRRPPRGPGDEPGADPPPGSSIGPSTGPSIASIGTPMDPPVGA